MITTYSAKVSDESNFIHGCFIVSVGTDFTTYQQIMQNAEIGEYSTQAGTQTGLEPNVKAVLSNISTGATKETNTGALPVYFSKRKCRDTSLGGNDSINPLPQFGVDDDISHPHFQVGVGASVGMGQVYSENFDDNQQILYMGFGIPAYSNVSSFWANAIDTDMAGFVNKGGGMTAEKIGYLLAATPITLINIATIPYKFIAGVADTLQKVPITKYYAFSSQMPMYFRYVNSIMIHLATNMNMMGSSTDYSTTGSNVSGTTAIDLQNSGTSASQDMSGISTVFKQYGFDMAKIMTKRFLYENGNLGTLGNRYTDEAMFKAAALNDGNGVVEPIDSNQSSNSTPNATNSSTTTNADGTTSLTLTDSSTRSWSMQFFDSFTAAYKDAIYDGHLFIGFRIDRGQGASESFSNSTGESQLAQVANAKFQEGQEARFDTMNGKFGSGTITGALTSIIGGMKDVFNGFSKALKMDPLAAVVTGSAKVDIPDVWMGSSYSRSASFSISCLAPYGDFESIIQSEYIPLACILAGTLPRGTGYSSHSGPFICQAYCRGIFSSPLCMIESLEITRGADQFGFTAARLPLKIQMHITLKDLSPTMYVSMMGTAGLAAQIFGTDDNFGEYLLTLSGMGLRDRLAPFKSMRRKTQILLGTLYANKLSPFMLGMEGGSQFLVSRVISSIVGAGRNLPGN